MDIVVSISMNAKQMRMNLNQVTTATTTPTVLTQREALPASVEMVTLEMESPVEVRLALYFYNLQQENYWKFVTDSLKIMFLNLLDFFPDVDECSTSTPCHEKANCVNTQGGYYCKCKEGTVQFFLNNTNLTFLAFLHKIYINGFQNQQNLGVEKLIK